MLRCGECMSAAVTETCAAVSACRVTHAPYFGGANAGAAKL